MHLWQEDTDMQSSFYLDMGPQSPPERDKLSMQAQNAVRLIIAAFDREVDISRHIRYGCRLGISAFPYSF